MLLNETMNKSSFEMALRLFQSAVKAVSPLSMIRTSLVLRDSALSIEDKSYQLTRNIFVIAFGKAVLGMCRAVEDLLGDHIVRGIASVPTGIQEVMNCNNMKEQLLRPGSRIEVLEGAANNLPDENAHRAAQKILNLAQSLTKDDLLIVLVSGGGSALLPLPVEPITLSEKLLVTRLLASCGANIEELNTVRKRLSQIKGGRLARSAYPASVVSLILSDIVNDPLDMIACGPTVPDRCHPSAAGNIVDKYGLRERLPPSVLRVLNSEPADDKPSEDVFRRVQNVLIGSSRIALEEAAACARAAGFQTRILTDGLVGEARSQSRLFIDAIKAYLGLETAAEGDQSWLHECYLNGQAVCILTGGETTVRLSERSGKGGRNQEMVLSFLLDATRLNQQHATLTQRCQFVFCSAGTDGQDGPTDAAGAAVDSTQLSLDIAAIEDHLNRNDSYNYFSSYLPHGLIRTGLTGTNVMDIQILLLSSPQENDLLLTTT